MVQSADPFSMPLDSRSTIRGMACGASVLVCLAAFQNCGSRATELVLESAVPLAPQASFGDSLPVAVDPSSPSPTSGVQTPGLPSFNQMPAPLASAQPRCVSETIRYADAIGLESASAFGNGQFLVLGRKGHNGQEWPGAAAIFNVSARRWRTLSFPANFGGNYRSAVLTYIGGNRWFAADASESSGFVAAIYDDESRAWRATSAPPVPPSHRNGIYPGPPATVAWTGSKVLVWLHGHGAARSSSGYLYDPATDAWTAIATSNARPRSVGAPPRCGRDRSYSCGPAAQMEIRFNGTTTAPCFLMGRSTTSLATNGLRSKLPRRLRPARARPPSLRDERF